MLELINSIWRKPRKNLAQWLSERWSNCSFGLVFFLLCNRFCIVFPPLLKKSSTVTVSLKRWMFEKFPLSERLFFPLHSSDLEWNGSSSGLGGRLLYDSLPAVERTVLIMELSHYGILVIEICLLSCRVSFLFCFWSDLGFFHLFV